MEAEPSSSSSEEVITITSFLSSSGGSVRNSSTATAAEPQGSIVLSTHGSSSVKLSWLKECLCTLHPTLPKDFIIQYRDDEDILTIACDSDLQEAFQWVKANKKDRKLHLFLISKKENKTLLYGITKLLMDLSIKKEEESSSSFLFVEGSYWKGVCVYSEQNESFPLVLTVCKVTEQDNVVEGIIEWTTLGTKFMGLVSRKDGTTTFKFREYEAIRGEDEIELPNNYKGSVVANKIEGDILKAGAKFSLGPQRKVLRSYSQQYPVMQLQQLNEQLQIPKNPKRKYNLSDNNSLERPSMQDQQLAFKKLTRGSDLWYDPKQTKGELQPRSQEEIDASGYRRSCISCGCPLFEGPDKTVTSLVCSNYPHCEPAPSYVYHWFFFIPC